MLLQHYRTLMLIAIVYIKEMLPLPFAVVYGTHDKYVLSYWPDKKQNNCHLFLDLTRKWQY